MTVNNNQLNDEIAQINYVLKNYNSSEDKNVKLRK